MNFDCSPTLKIEKLPVVGKVLTGGKTIFPAGVMYGDILKGLPVADGSCAGVYSCHVLEHLSYADMKKALENTYRILAPGGIFRVVVPDLEDAINKYKTSGEPAAAHEFMRSTLLGYANRPDGLIARIRSVFGNSNHLWMYDYHSLELELKNAGFKKIRRCRFNDSDDKAFLAVEDPSRFVDAVAIECTK